MFFRAAKFPTNILAVLGLLLFVGLLAVLFFRLSQGRNPNVLLISIDTLRADHLGCYGYSRSISPNIDSLAKEGTIFLDALSHAPRTTQSHMSMMTSLHPDVHQVQICVKDKPSRRLNNKVYTLAEILKEHGYKTAAFTTGVNVGAAQGFDKGFNLFYEWLGFGQVPKIISWLKGNYKKKFFLFLHTMAIHDPYLPPSPYRRKFYPEYKGRIIDSWEQLWRQAKKDRCDWWEAHDIFWKNVDRDSPEDVDFLIAQYDAAINYIDAELVGSVLKELKGLNVYGNTLIIITADHGEEFNEHANLLHDDLYVEVMRVPIVMVYPGRIPKNKKVGQLVRLTDIMPTILDILGIKTDFLVQGKSLLPAITKDKELNLSCYSVFENTKALRTHSYTFIERNDKNGNVAEYLYDRQKDFNEKNNIINEGHDIAAELKRQLNFQIEDYKKIGVRYKPIDLNLPDPDSQKLLKSLGYLK